MPVGPVKFRGEGKKMAGAGRTGGLYRDVGTRQRAQPVIQGPCVEK